MLVSDVRCGDLYCRVEGTHPLRFYLFGLTKLNLRGCRLHRSKEVEVFVRKWFRMQDCYIYPDTVVKHLTKNEFYIKAFVNCGEKNDTVVGSLSS
jgi:hypothetical protein